MPTIQERLAEIRTWPDERLTAELHAAALEESRSLTTVLLRLQEFIRRGLSESKGYSSAVAYCIKQLGYSKSGSYRRAIVARAGLRVPRLFELIEGGDLHLVGAAMLARHLTAENQAKILGCVIGKSEDEIGRFVAWLAPGQRPRDQIRIVSARKPNPSEWGAELSELSQADPESTEEIHEVRFAASAETVELIRRAQAILSHGNPGKELDPILNRALKDLLKKIDRSQKTPKGKGKPKGPDSAVVVKVEAAQRGRDIPEAIKQEVWKRDEGRCTFVGTDGVRCGSDMWIEFDHIKPFALGGAHEVENLRLRCRAHNQLVAREQFGGPAPPR
jgi:5-methylcytosine-specific restriction endonuclease McrA